MGKEYGTWNTKHSDKRSSDGGVKQQGGVAGREKPVQSVKRLAQGGKEKHVTLKRDQSMPPAQSYPEKDNSLSMQLTLPRILTTAFSSRTGKAFLTGLVRTLEGAPSPAPRRGQGVSLA
jgi:hypothetical protein